MLELFNFATEEHLETLAETAAEADVNEELEGGIDHEKQVGQPQSHQVDLKVENVAHADVNGQGIGEVEEKYSPKNDTRVLKFVELMYS